jgi:hypothetical protein
MFIYRKKYGTSNRKSRIFLLTYRIICIINYVNVLIVGTGTIKEKKMVSNKAKRKGVALAIAATLQISALSSIAGAYIAPLSGYEVLDKAGAHSFPINHGIIGGDYDKDPGGDLFRLPKRFDPDKGNRDIFPEPMGINQSRKGLLESRLEVNSNNFFNRISSSFEEVKERATSVFKARFSQSKGPMDEIAQCIEKLAKKIRGLAKELAPIKQALQKLFQAFKKLFQ